MKALTEDHLSTLRRHMVEVIDIEYDLTSQETGRVQPDERVRAVMMAVPRHLFVPPQLGALAYQDRPLPIGFDKTISQPFIGALMVDLLDLEPGDRVLEIGTGLGYQTALLANLASEVWSVDVVEEFIEAAAARLAHLGLGNIALRVGDGSRGWPEEAPFDAILVSAAAKEIPSSLATQLKIGGRIVLPVGVKGAQRLVRGERIGEDEVAVIGIMGAQFTELETGP